MNLTATQAIPYPDPEDHGAGGRQMQDMAERLEDRFNAIDLAYLARRNPPSWIARRTSAQTINTSPTEPTVAVWQSVDFDTSGNRAPTLSGSTTEGRLAIDGRPEVWWVGVYAKLTLAGAPPNYRRVTVVVESFDTLTGARQVQTFANTARYSGANFFVIEGALRVQTNAIMRVEMIATASATVNLDVGSFCWATRISQE